MQARQREVRTARPDQRLKVKLAGVVALAPGLHPFSRLPQVQRTVIRQPGSEGIPEGFHDHETIKDGRWQYCRCERKGRDRNDHALGVVPGQARGAGGGWDDRAQIARDAYTSGDLVAA